MPRLHRPEVLVAATDASQGSDGVLSMARLRELGVSRGQREAQAAARRWTTVPRRGVVTTTGSPSGDAALRVGLISVGPTAAVGGASALVRGGLTGYTVDGVHLWVHKSGFKTVVPGVVLHETRRWDESHVSTHDGIRCSTLPVATVQAALWAVTLRQAALLLVMPVQQRLVKVDDVAVEFDRVRRHRFRRALAAVLADIAGGAQSVNELDFARMCREHHLPEPSRQVSRTSSTGRIHLDVFWEAYGVGVEVNGAQHGELIGSMSDELRLIDVQISGDALVPVSVITLRIDPEPFFRQLERLLRSRGWRGPSVDVRAQAS